MGDTNLDHLHPDLRARWVAFRDGPWARQNGVYLLSGYRSTARQRVLYARYIASGRNRRYLAAPPGTSKHERTLNGRPAAQAIDIHPTSGDYMGMHRTARAYGLHFPLWHGGQSEIMHAEINYSIPFRATPAPPPPEEDDLKPDERAALMGVADALLSTKDPRNPGIVHFLKNEMRPQAAANHMILKQLQGEITGTQSDYWKRIYEVRDRLTIRTAKMLVRATNALLRRLDKPQDVTVEEVQ